MTLELINSKEKEEKTNLILEILKPLYKSELREHHFCELELRNLCEVRLNKQLTYSKYAVPINLDSLKNLVQFLISHVKSDNVPKFDLDDNGNFYIRHNLYLTFLSEEIKIEFEFMMEDHLAKVS